jgi:hypothetical protein
MHHKRNDLSRGATGRAIHKLCSARSNDGLCAAVSKVLHKAGITKELSSTMLEVLGQAEERSKAAKKRKASIPGKAKRRDAKTKRKNRNAPIGEKAYGANMAFDDDDLLPTGDGPAVQPPPAKKARAPPRCGICGQQGHTKRTCSVPPPAAPAAAPATA